MTTTYSKVDEFDSLVNEYLTYLDSWKDPKHVAKTGIKNLIAGVTSVFGLFSGSYPTHEEVMAENKHPLYVDGLDDSKRNLIVLASDFKRRLNSLEGKIQSGEELVGIDEEITVTRRVYDYFRESYAGSQDSKRLNN